ncbi:MAG: DUF1294 domain-containing protein [Eubacteriales bacterium]|nr:DUF1294 domain-containing protein [Eubacteriales bacterium]
MKGDLQLLFWAVVAGVNIYALLLMKVDKENAAARRRRVPEKQLFWTAALFGSVGIFVGMQVFRHKTRHLSFIIGIPALFTLQTALVMAYYLWPQIVVLLPTG